jgi:cytochrome c556
MGAILATIVRVSGSAVRLASLVTFPCSFTAHARSPLYSVVPARQAAGLRQQQRRNGDEQMKKATIVRLMAIAAIVTAGPVGIQALAHADDLPAAIDARKALMKDNGAQMKAISAVVDAKAGDMADVQKRAAAVQANAAKIPSLFTPGSGTDAFPGKTNAKAEIWQEFDTFKQDAAMLGSEAGKLADAAKSGDMNALSAQFDATGQKCGACHKQFRVPLK